MRIDSGLEVCWYPIVGGCFRPAVAIYRAGTKEMPVCAGHQGDMSVNRRFRRIELP